MLNSTLLEFILRGIPEGFLFIFAGYTFSKTKVDVRKYLLAGALLSVIGYAIRLLPINFGIHSVLVLITCVILLNAVSKIPLIKAISSTLVMMIIGFAAEIVNGVLVALIRGFRFMDILRDFELINIDFANPTQKVLYGLPSMALMWLIVLIFYFVYKKRDKLINASDRETIE